MQPVRSSLASLFAFTLVGASACSGEQPATSEEQSFTQFTCTSVEAEPGSPRVYFQPFDDAELEALCLLDRAKEEVLVAQYNIRNQSYLDKLVQLSERGVRVRVAVDEKNSQNEWNVGDDFLEANGIELLRTDSAKGGLMHLKITVVDSTWAMTGSFNWNETATLANDENMIVFAEPEVVEVYRNHVLDLLDQASSRVESTDDPSRFVLFVPEQSAEKAIVDRIAAATTSVDVAMFTFTSKPIATALAVAAQRGVRVRAVLERKQLGSGAIARQLEQAGAEVVRAANRIGAFSAMHQKYGVIDGTTVITGATNWTRAGTFTNDEDLLVITSPELATDYARNFADLLHVYDRQDDPEAPTSDESGVLFNAIFDGTYLGDRMVVTGSHPALGSWDPWRGAELETSDTLFPSWTANAKLPAGERVEYKFVVIRGDGRVEWEPGPNRVLDLPESGRSVVITGPYGDTSKSSTPAEN
jgi:phosphatidylserine/phosphatidylglycerophosphate/cardiolipin synthase-like enzyme